MARSEIICLPSRDGDRDTPLNAAMTLVVEIGCQGTSEALDGSIEIIYG